MSSRNNYKTLIEGYGGGSAFSIYGGLLNNSCRTILKGYDCWCRQADHSRCGCDTLGPTPKLNKDGQCYNQLCCADCDLNRTGLCPQGSGQNGVAGVN